MALRREMARKSWYRHAALSVARRPSPASVMPMLEPRRRSAHMSVIPPRQRPVIIGTSVAAPTSSHTVSHRQVVAGCPTGLAGLGIALPPPWRCFRPPGWFQAISVATRVAFSPFTTHGIRHMARRDTAVTHGCLNAVAEERWSGPRPRPEQCSTRIRRLPPP